MLTRHALHSLSSVTYGIMVLPVSLIFIKSIFLFFLFPATIRENNTGGVPTLIQFSKEHTTVRTENGPALSNKTQAATTATTPQSAQTSKSQYNKTVKITQSAQFSTEQTTTVRTTQTAQATAVKDNTTVRTTKNSTQLSKAKVDSSIGTAKKRTSKPFVYLTQTEKCLPQNLNAIGDELTCDCDVIVLSYRKVCQEDNRTHFSYIFVGEGSWNLGRNILYSVAKERLPGYHYYIFLDDDVDLRFNSLTPHEMKGVSPFRAFEAWLLDYEPAVGIVDQPGPQNAMSILQKRRMKCGINESSMAVPAVWFDAIFNAFHYKAIKHILPYPTQYDKESWWASQLHVMCSMELKFRGQTLMFVPVTVNNPQHRQYPRSGQRFGAQARTFVKDIQKSAPAVYQNRPLFEKLKSRLLIEYPTLEASTYCMNVSRHQPIVPYLHFESTNLET